MSAKIDRKTKNSQSLKEFVNKVKKLRDFNIELEGNIEEILKDPRAWADKIAEEQIVLHSDKIKSSKKLGEEFANAIIDKS